MTCAWPGCRPAVLVRVMNGRVETYTAVDAAAAEEVTGGLAGLFGAAGLGGEVTAEVVPWSVLPGVEAVAARTLARNPGWSVLIIGAASGGKWDKWYPPGDPPPPPARPRGA